jgi:hypothetical protein
MQKIWLVAKREGHRLPPALLFLYEPLCVMQKNPTNKEIRNRNLINSILFANR